jgi:hypothetical protein
MQVWVTVIVDVIVVVSVIVLVLVLRRTVYAIPEGPYIVEREVRYHGDHGCDSCR